MRNKGQLLQDPFLNALRRERIPVSMFLVNGIKLQGLIESFDQYSVVLKGTASQMVFKHAISTIVPVRRVNMAEETSGEERQGDDKASPVADAGNKTPQITIKRPRARSVTV